MTVNELEKDSAFIQTDDLYNRKTQAVPAPEKPIGLDTKNVLYGNIIGAVESSSLDISKFESLSQVSQGRDTLYDLFDTMCEDPAIAAVIETYAEDATEYNDRGEVLWCESGDPKVAKFVTFLLNVMNVDKNAYQWVYSLIKYGDLYLRLFHESDYANSLFSEKEEEEIQRKNLYDSLSGVGNENKELLTEDVKAVAYAPSDKFVHYLEMVKNPAEMFELTRFGKSYGYVQANVALTRPKKETYLGAMLQRYNIKRKDVKIYTALNFVHASLNDSVSRTTEELNISTDSDPNSKEALSFTYTVKRGQSLLYNVFKIWREMMLLENALLLNRLTKSSLVRVLNIEVGDMPKESVGPHLARIKQLIEQKSAINEGNSLQEYTNPGPMENNIYVPTHNGQGTITPQQVGGDVDVKGLADIDYFRDKLYGALKVPKQMFGFTEDGAGFNGGQSLSILSSRYAKTIKRVQNAFIQAITDAINIMLLDKGLDSYINKFTLKMQVPTTQEELDRRENLDSKVGIINNIMMLLDPVQDESAKLKILTALLSTVVSDNDIISVLNEQINKLTEMEEETPEEVDESDDSLEPHTPMSAMRDRPSERPSMNVDSKPDTSNTETETPSEEPSETILPTPSDLGIDMTDNNAEM